MPLYISVVLLFLLFLLQVLLEIEVKAVFCTVYYFVFMYVGAGCCITVEAHHYILLDI